VHVLLDAIEEKMGAPFEAVGSRFSAIEEKIDARVDSMSVRLAAIDEISAAHHNEI
jgi:hypothetical protein